MALTLPKGVPVVFKAGQEHGSHRYRVQVCTVLGQVLGALDADYGYKEAAETIAARCTLACSQDAQAVSE